MIGLQSNSLKPLNTIDKIHAGHYFSQQTIPRILGMLYLRRTLRGLQTFALVKIP